jgi:hypothetical protein
MENKLYKIVKSYPFSPPVGTILHYDSFADWYQNANEDYIVESRIIEKHPEYFEEHYDENSIFGYGVFGEKHESYLKWTFFDFGDDTKAWKEWKGKGMKFFKNREQAEEYVVLNKPCLSITELFELSNQKDSCIGIRRASELKELVKSKI